MILFNGERIPLEQFPNGESRLLKPFFSENQISDFRSDTVNTVTMQYESDADLMQLLFVRKSLWFDTILEIPYLPYSRMDRNSVEFAFTLKALCKYLNWLDFASIELFEPHSDVAPALLNHVKVHRMLPRLLHLAGYNHEKDYILYPDSSAYKRYAEELETPRELIAVKKRVFDTGRIEHLGLLFGDESTTLEGKKVWIVDDLCSKGGTFVVPAGWARSRGAKEVNLVVAHCESAIYRGQILPAVDGVYTTDSIVHPTVIGDNSKMHIFHYR